MQTKFGTKLQFEYPTKCPQGCILKPASFYQGCICTKCPVFCCKQPITEEDKIYMPILKPNDFRDDWAEEWDIFFKTGKQPRLYSQEQDDECDKRVEQAEKEMRTKVSVGEEAFDKLSEEFEVVCEIAVKEKPMEQFRQEMVDDLFQEITKETNNSATFTENGNYYNAKLTEAKIEGLHKSLSIILEVSTIDVKEC